jgi:hypothetical protein
MPRFHGEETPVSVRPVRIESPPNTMSVPPTQVSLIDERYQPLRGSEEKPIHDPDYTSNVSGQHIDDGTENRRR